MSARAISARATSPRIARARELRVFGLAMVLEVIGGAAVLLISGRDWQTLFVARPRPLADVVVAASGRTLDPAATGLAVVALAGVVAVLATRGLGRRIVGAVVVLSGAGICWRAATGFGAVSASRARALVAAAGSGVGIGDSSPTRVSVHPGWPVAEIAFGVLIVVAGVLVLARGAAWSTMSARYEAPSAPAGADGAARNDGALWSALDRGDDPTADEQRVTGS
jgi:uncharacterized membrane protein (TIGR02234 family)